MPPEPSLPRAPHRLIELALFFLRFGLTAFGGPAAHIALMQTELVERRGWLRADELMDLVSAANLIPGPNSTEVAIHIGYRRAGRAGLVVAGACFILPAALLVGVIAWAYTRYHALPAVGDALAGIKPVMVAVVVQALWGLRKTVTRSKLHGATFVATFVAGLLGANELALLFAAGAVGAVAATPPAVAGAAGSHALSPPEPPDPRAPPARPGPGLVLFPLIGAVGGAVLPFSLGALFLFFLKVGAVLFGSGYVLLAFLRADLVERWRWLTEAQLLDAIAVGQVTPGPVFTTATFIGYLLGGAPGAALATVGIFLPAFFFVAITAPILPRLRRSTRLAGFLDGVNAASLALMAAVSIELGRAAFHGAVSIAIGLVAAVALLRFKVNATWLVLGGGLAGALVA